MECTCELYFHVAKSICLLVVLLIDNAALIGIAVLFVICLVITLERFWNPEDSLVIQIKPTEAAKIGETVYLEGNVQFHHSLTCLKWQKYHNGGFVDINIHKPKYKGTTNTWQNPTLVLNDIDLDDEVKYRIEVQRTKSTEYSNLQTIHIVPVKEDISIEIFGDQNNNKYYVGEDVTINTKIQNHSNVLCATWQRKTETGSQAINTTLQKYAGSNEQRLKIRECNESDIGTYFLLVACKDDMEYVTSNDLDLKVIKGYPSVCLNQVPEALYGTCVELQAKIRSFPKHDRMVWLKKHKQIDISEPKYNGSLVIGDTPKLCIKEVDKNDDAKYELYVYNEFGKGVSNEVELKVIGEKPEVDLMISKQSQSVTYGNTINLEATIVSLPAPVSIQWGKDGDPIQSDSIKFATDRLDDGTNRLSIRYLEFNDSGKYSVLVTNALGSTYKEIDIVVKGDSIIFIAGPVVVSPSDTIWLRTIFPTSTQIADEKWFITKNDIIRRIKSTDQGVSLKTSQSQPVFQTLEIKPAVEHGGTFHLSVESSGGTLKSNKINVFVDDSRKFATEREGNCLRFYALQAVSRDAMEKALDSMPGTFQSKLQTYVNMCISKKRNTNLPTPLPSTSRNLDISQMYSIFRNGINIIPPRKGWGNFPDANDTNMADDIERLRKYRNKISHENSSEMTTVDFNESVLDLIRAIRRLTSDDEQLLKQTSEILNKIFCKGRELDSMMEKLNELRDLVSKEEDLLKEDQTNISIQNDTQTIHLTGDAELKEGQKAKFSAFIKPTVSNLSKVFWQRIDSKGNIFTIDLKDGKYIGSTTTLPSPQLYVYFVRREDEGTYRIVIDTYQKVIESSIQLKVNTRDDDTKMNDTENSDTSNEIGFHEVHNPNIYLLNDNKIARKGPDGMLSGICFTNQPLNVGENIYLRIVETEANVGCLDFGVTNTNPAVSINNQSITSIYSKGSILQDA